MRIISKFLLSVRKHIVNGNNIEQKVMQKNIQLTGNTVFYAGSHHEIYEFIRNKRVAMPKELIFRSRGLRLLYAIIGILIYRREHYAESIDNNLIKKTLEFDNVKRLCDLDIPSSYKYELERYLRSLPNGYERMVHSKIISFF